MRVRVRVEVGARARITMTVGPRVLVGMEFGLAGMGMEQRARAYHVGGARLSARDVLAADEAQPEAAVQGKARACER